MRYLFACAAAAQLVTAAVDLKSIKHSSTAQFVPDSYIVELSTGTHLKRGFASPHEELYHDLKRRGANWKVTKEYADDLLTGAAVKLGSKADLVKLAEATGVQSISRVHLYQPPKPVYQRAVNDKDAKASEDVLSTHVMTGVDKLHNEGYFGKGITIGIIDTGIDYNHPALGGKFGPGNKIIGGYDFVGDNYTAGEEPAPDDDPMDNCNGHGTHVAGIIGANPNNPYNITGVAYQSLINAYRVFGCKGGGSDDVFIDALLRAYKDGNDVINLSLGGVKGWTEGVVGVVASRIADKGRIVVIAAGNDGDFGSWYAASPSTGLNVISVGSIDNTVLSIQNAITSNGRKIPYLGLKNLDIEPGLPIYATSQDPTVADDACDPLPSTTPDLSKSLVLIRRGACFYVNKTANAAAFGAKNFLIYDNEDGPLIENSFEPYQGAVISKADGEFLLKEAIPKKLTVSFPNSPGTVPNPTGGRMSYFSTYGPTFDMYLKPSVSAPGGKILSTYPIALGPYHIDSGTSMASPFVAGSAALLLQIRGKNAETAKAARAIFQNTAVPVRYAANDSLIATASHQGAGLVNVYDAIKNTGSLLPAELLLNDTAYFKGEHTLKLHNGGKDSVTYTLSHVPAGTANTIDGGVAIPGPVPLTNNSATVKIEPAQITVPAGQAVQFKVTIQPPTGLDATKFPIYSGYIKATGSDQSTLQSTYLGLAATLKDAKIIDKSDAYFGVKSPAIMDAEGNPVPDGGSATYTMNGTDTPIVVYRLNMGTPLLRIDLIDSQTNAATDLRRSSEATIVPAERTTYTLSRRSVQDWVLGKGKTHSGSFEAVKTLGVLSQGDYLPRNSPATTAEENGYATFQVATFANGTAIPDGSYKLLFRALKITGNPQAEADYEGWTSPTLVVKRP